MFKLFAGVGFCGVATWMMFEPVNVMGYVSSLLIGLYCVMSAEL